MANDTSANPFVLDTVTDSLFAAGAYFDIYAVRWTSGSLADAVSLQDMDSAVKWSATGTIANNVDQTVFNPPLVMNGIKIPTLGSGKVYVYCKQTR